MLLYTHTFQIFTHKLGSTLTETPNKENPMRRQGKRTGQDDFKITFKIIKFILEDLFKLQPVPLPVHICRCPLFQVRKDFIAENHLLLQDNSAKIRAFFK